MSRPAPSPSSAGGGSPAAVLDASAVLAWLRDEPGAAVVSGYLDDAVISAVNLAEVHQKLAQRGVDADRTIRQLRSLGIDVRSFDSTDALAASRLWPATRAAGLSLGDRCCLDEAWIADPDGMRIVLVEIPSDHPLRIDVRNL